MADQVIDLTNTSFTLADHSAMANVIIELDDTLNESELQHSTVHHEALGVVDVSSDVTRTSETSLEPWLVLPVRQRKKSRIPKRKMVQPCQPKSEAGEATIRERSPVGTQLECPICFERLGTNRLASTKCGHVFCEKCIIRALRTVKRCPTCRQALRGNNAFHPLFLSKG